MPQREKKMIKKKGRDSEKAVAPGLANDKRPREQRIATRAHELFLERGGEHGNHEADWYQAEAEFLAEDERTKLGSSAGRH